MLLVWIHPSHRTAALLLPAILAVVSGVGAAMQGASMYWGAWSVAECEDSCCTAEVVSSWVLGALSLASLAFNACFLMRCHLEELNPERHRYAHMHKARHTSALASAAEEGGSIRQLRSMGERSTHSHHSKGHGSAHHSTVSYMTTAALVCDLRRHPEIVIGRSWLGIQVNVISGYSNGRVLAV